MKKALIIINVSKNESMTLSQEISKFLQEKGVLTDSYNFDGFNKNVPFKDYDFVVTLGGDGTVLYAARNSVEQEIPLFPVNLGQFGFIASIQPGEWKIHLEDFINGKAVLVERSMIEASVIRDGKKIYSSLGLNDVVISAKRAATTVSLAVNYDDLPLCRMKADGVIISTSTGSTAYSAAAGGPIVDPQLKTFILTPVNSFSLSSRPIVLSPEGQISIQIENSRTKDVSITVDGQEPVSLEIGDTVFVKKYKKNIKLISCTRERFYNALRSKLNWSGGPHA